MNRDYMIVPFEYKASDTDDGVLEGYASVFGNVDHHGDVMVKGAFAKTIRERIPKGDVPLIDAHGFASGVPVPTSRDVIGTVVAAREDERGLFIRAKLSDAESVRDIRTKLREGHIKTMSIGYVPVRTDWDTVEYEGRKIRARMIQEVKLGEVSITPIPANELAAITAVKSLVDGVDEWSDEGREALAAVAPQWDAEYKTADPEPADAPPDVADDAPAGLSPEAKARELVRRAEALLAGRDPDRVGDAAKIAGDDLRVELAHRRLSDALKVDEEIRKMNRVIAS